MAFLQGGEERVGQTLEPDANTRQNFQGIEPTALEHPMENQQGAPNSEGLLRFM